MITIQEARQLQLKARQVLKDNKGHDIRFKPMQRKKNESAKQGKSTKK